MFVTYDENRIIARALENKAMEADDGKVLPLDYKPLTLVRCRECGDCRSDGYCERFHHDVKPDWFCADGYR